MRGRLFVIVLTVLTLVLLASGLGAAADRAAIRDLTTGLPGAMQSPTTDLDDLFGVGTVTPEMTGTPDMELQETVTPTTRVGSPTPQETVTPTTRAGSPTPQETMTPTVRAGSPTPQETRTPTIRAGSPTPQETVTPTVRAGSPTPQETGTPTVPAASPTPQDMEDQQLVQILPQIYEQFECYDTVTTVRWELDNGGQGIVVVTGKVVTDPLAERWDIIIRRQGETASVIEVVRGDGQTLARTVGLSGTSNWESISPEMLQTLSQLSWIADLSALLDVGAGELVGQATINDLETNQYEYTQEDFQARPHSFTVQDASADVWFSTEYDVPVKTVINLEGTNILGTTGDVVVQSQLTNINENCNIQLPQVQPETPTPEMGETELVLADALGLSEFKSYRLQSNFDWTPRNARGFSGQLNAQVTYDTPAEFASLALQGVRAAAFPPYVEYVNYQGEMYLRIGMDGEWVSAEDAELTNLIRQLGEAINPTDFFQTEDCELIEENVEINGQMTDHYRCITQNVTGEPFFRRLSQATVDIWRVQGSDAYVRMNMSVQAETAQGMSGVLNLRANVTDIGEPVNIQEPELGSSEGVVTPPITGTPTVSPTGTTTPTRTGTPAGTPTGAVTGTPTGTATLPPSPTGTRTRTATPPASPTGTRTLTRTGTPAGTATLPLSPTITRTGTATLPASPTVTRIPTGTGTPLGTATLPGSPTITVTGTVIPENTPTSVFTTTQSMGQLPWDGDDNDDDINDDDDDDDINDDNDDDINDNDDDDDDDDDMPSMMQTATPGQQPRLTPTASQVTPVPPTTQQMTICPLPFLMPCDNLEATYMVDVSSQQVLQFYSNWMTQMGWTEMSTQVENGVIFEMDGQELLVTAVEADGRTLVHLVKLTDGATPTATPSV